MFKRFKAWYIIRYTIKDVTYKLASSSQLLNALNSLVRKSKHKSSLISKAIKECQKQNLNLNTLCFC